MFGNRVNGLHFCFCMFFYFTNNYENADNTESINTTMVKDDKISGQ